MFLPVDREAYDEASAGVMATLRSLEWGGRPVVVEVLGWDEAFLRGPVRDHAPADRRMGAAALGGARRGATEVEAGQGSLHPRGRGPWVGHDPLTIRAVRAHRERVLAETRLHCSVGIGDNKLRAKIATDFGKPRGAWVLTEDNWFEVMGARPTKALWGIGSKTAKKLAALGIDTVDQLAHSDARVLAAELGPTMGPWYHRIGRGVSDSAVSAEPWVPRAHGRETTFQEDIEDWDRIAEEVRTLTRQVVRGHRQGGPAGGAGRAQAALPPVLHDQPQPHPPGVDQRPRRPRRRGGVSLLERVEKDRPVRLLGVRLEMVPPEGGY